MPFKVKDLMVHLAPAVAADTQSPCPNKYCTACSDNDSCCKPTYGCEHKTKAPQCAGPSVCPNCSSADTAIAARKHTDAEAVTLRLLRGELGEFLSILEERGPALN
jgi:hypothetical protein